MFPHNSSCAVLNFFIVNARLPRSFLNVEKRLETHCTQKVFLRHLHASMRKVNVGLTSVDVDAIYMTTLTSLVKSNWSLFKVLEMKVGTSPADVTAHYCHGEG